jgi:glutaredoxin-related protein
MSIFQPALPDSKVRKIMNKVACLLVAAALCGPCFAQDANKAQATANTKTVTITGTIKNFDEFKALVDSESYVQLVPLAADGKRSIQLKGVAVNNIVQVRFAFNSNTPKLPVPKKAAFSFSLPNTLPGRYFLAAQFLIAQDGDHGHRPDFVTEKNGQLQTYLIDIPADSKSPVTIAAGELIVWTH